MTPTQLVRTWVERFNRADIDGLIELYAEDAVNDQVVFSKPLRGREEIRAMFALEFSRAKMVCLEEHIYEDGDTAILQWRDPNGLRGCGFFRVMDGRIVHQQGYFDQLTFFRAQGLPIPDDYLEGEEP